MNLYMYDVALATFSSLMLKICPERNTTEHFYHGFDMGLLMKSEIVMMFVLTEKVVLEDMM